MLADCVNEINSAYIFGLLASLRVLWRTLYLIFNGKWKYNASADLEMENYMKWNFIPKHLLFQIKIIQKHSVK